MQLSTGIFLIFNIACAVANSTGQLLAFRLLSGLAGSAPLALGGGVLSDVWSPVDLARAMALFSLGVRPCNIPARDLDVGTDGLLFHSHCLDQSALQSSRDSLWKTLIGVGCFGSSLS